MKVLPFLLFTLFTVCKTLYLNKLSVNNHCLRLFTIVYGFRHGIFRFGILEKTKKRDSAPPGVSMPQLLAEVEKVK